MAGSLIHKHEAYKHSAEDKFENTVTGELITREQLGKIQSDFNDWVLANPVHSKREGKRVRKKKSHSASSRTAEFNRRVELTSPVSNTMWDEFSGSGLKQDPVSVFNRRVLEPRPVKKVSQPKEFIDNYKKVPLVLKKKGDVLRVTLISTGCYKIVTRYPNLLGGNRYLIVNTDIHAINSFKKLIK